MTLEETYNKLLNNSIPEMRAIDKRTMRQMLVNVLFFHSEFGMSAGLLILSCRRIQNAKAGMRAMLSISRTIFADRLILVISAESFLNSDQ